MTVEEFLNNYKTIRLMIFTLIQPILFIGFVLDMLIRIRRKRKGFIKYFKSTLNDAKELYLLVFLFRDNKDYDLWTGEYLGNVKQ